MAPRGLGVDPPSVCDPIVVSLMHTGTRSLQAQLDIHYARHINTPDAIEYLKTNRNPWHVPVREPCEHFLSLAQKRDGLKGEWLANMLHGMAALIELTDGRADVTFYRVRDLSRHIGPGGAGAYANRCAVDAMAALVAWMTPRRRAFYARWFD